MCLKTGTDTVLVVEYGYYDSQTGMNPRRMFNITSQPCPNLNGRSFSVGIGCVVGGSSSVNGQVFLRGTKDEYNAWKELGGSGSTWDWDNLLPYFKKASITLDMAFKLQLTILRVSPLRLLMLLKHKNTTSSMI